MIDCFTEVFIAIDLSSIAIRNNDNPCMHSKNSVKLLPTLFFICMAFTTDSFLFLVGLVKVAIN